MSIRQLLRLSGATVALLLAFSSRGYAEYDGCTDLCLQLQSKCEFLLEPEWYCGISLQDCVNQCEFGGG